MKCLWLAYIGPGRLCFFAARDEFLASGVDLKLASFAEHHSDFFVALADMYNAGGHFPDLSCADKSGGYLSRGSASNANRL